MKKILHLIVLLFLALTAFSQNLVDETEAKIYANSFLNNVTSLKNANLDLVAKLYNDSNTATCLYIFNAGDKGFIIISGSYNAQPVFAYSTTSSFLPIEELPENIASWLENYRNSVQYVMEHPEAKYTNADIEWDNLKSNIVISKSNSSVAALCQTQWNQDCYYNESCPSDYNGPCGHVYSGCVACAMSQIMKYHNHPQHGFGTHTYSYDNYGSMTVDFEHTTYDWNNMPNSTYSSNEAISTLMYHCGVSVNMQYGPYSSGAFSTDVDDALRSYFGYCGATHKSRATCSDEAWISMLKTELDNSRPVYYSGNNGNAGHAFVCDGYDNNNYFHFNWGWSGYGDGFFSLNDVNGFSQSQEAVINITPLVINNDENGIIYVSSDGTGDGSSWENATSQLEFATSRSNDGIIKIWVKKGVYYGNAMDSINAFYMMESNRVYGGFNGDEPADYDLSLRDFENNASILDGQNIKRVLFQNDKYTSATRSVWDGFTIRNGNSGAGAGVYMNDYSTLSNSHITDNTSNSFGGGIYINSSSTENHVFITNCNITNNTASMGGGICDRYSTEISNCKISNNTATTKGGGLYIYANVKSSIKSSVISNNNAKSGAGIFTKGKINMLNCDILSNSASEENGGIYNENIRNNYTNCIIWGNKAAGNFHQIEGSATFKYCAIQNGFEGENNINLAAENVGDGQLNYVQFIQPAEGCGAAFVNADWSLQALSSCINSGMPNTIGLPTNDMNGNLRIQNGRVEIGAFESCVSSNHVDISLCDGETYIFNGVELSESGLYQTIFQTEECDSVVSLTLTYLETPVISISGDTEISFGDYVTLTAMGGIRYLWSTGDTTESITVSPITSQDYEVVGYNEDGCSSSAEISVSVTGFATGELSANSTMLVPNPASGSFTVRGHQLRNVALYNAVGQKIVELHNISQEAVIDVSKLQNGIYYCRIETMNGEKIQKVIVNH